MLSFCRYSFFTWDCIDLNLKVRRQYLLCLSICGCSFFTIQCGIFYDGYEFRFMMGSEW